MIINRISVREYISESGRNPFREWLASLSLAARARVQARIFRISEGNLGDWKAVSGGIAELRVSFGPGYRVYFAREGNSIVLLLAGGDKGSQKKDIATAQRRWHDYKVRRTHAAKTR